MLKITIQISENKNSDSCNVKTINPKDLSKATENEKKVGATVINEIEKTLAQLEKK